MQGSWFLMGDFNNICQAQGRIGGNLIHEAGYIDLVNMMEKTGLFEKESNVDPLTWSNKQANGIIYSRIDIVIGNVELHHQNINTTLNTLEFGVSEHALLNLQG